MNAMELGKKVHSAMGIDLYEYTVAEKKAKKVSKGRDPIPVEKWLSNSDRLNFLLGMKPDQNGDLAQRAKVDIVKQGLVIRDGVTTSGGTAQQLNRFFSIGLPLHASNGGGVIVEIRRCVQFDPANYHTEYARKRFNRKEKKAYEEMKSGERERFGAWLSGNGFGEYIYDYLAREEGDRVIEGVVDRVEKNIELVSGEGEEIEVPA